MEPPIQYAQTSDGVNIAYWALGDGTPFVHMPWFRMSHVQLEWQIPEIKRWYDALASRVQLVRYDGRGIGLSQRNVSDYSRRRPRPRCRGRRRPAGDRPVRLVRPRAHGPGRDRLCRAPPGARLEARPLVHLRPKLGLLPIVRDPGDQGRHGQELGDVHEHACTRPAGLVRRGAGPTVRGGDAGERVSRGPPGVYLRLQGPRCDRASSQVRCPVLLLHRRQTFLASRGYGEGPGVAPSRCTAHTNRRRIGRSIPGGRGRRLERDHRVPRRRRRSVTAPRARRYRDHPLSRTSPNRRQ